MKTIFTSLCVVALSMASFAQNVLQSNFSELESNDDLTHITITGKMFEMMMEIESDDAELDEFLEAMSGVQGIEAYGNDQAGNEGFLENAVNQLGSEFEELISIDDPECNARVFIKEQNGVVTELVAIGEGEEGWGIGTIWGELDLNYVAKMASEVQVNGFKSVDKKSFETSADIRIFPNPANSEGQVTYDVPNELKGGSYILYDNKGTELSSGKILATQGKVSISGLPKANYVIKFQSKTGETFTKQFIVS